MRPAPLDQKTKVLIETINRIQRAESRFEVLGLEEGCSEEQIQEAYKKLIDVLGGDENSDENGGGGGGASGDDEDEDFVVIDSYEKEVKKEEPMSASMKQSAAEALEKVKTAFREFEQSGKATKSSSSHCIEISWKKSVALSVIASPSSQSIISRYSDCSVQITTSLEDGSMANVEIKGEDKESVQMLAIELRRLLMAEESGDDAGIVQNLDSPQPPKKKPPPPPRPSPAASTVPPPSHHHPPPPSNRPKPPSTPPPSSATTATSPSSSPPPKPSNVGGARDFFFQAQQENKETKPSSSFDVPPSKPPPPTPPPASSKPSPMALSPPSSSPKKTTTTTTRSEEDEKKMEETRKILDCLDHYETLSVPRDATPEQLRSAYKKFALRLHPDKNNSPLAAEAFKFVSAAFQTLNDPVKRAEYDIFLNFSQKASLRVKVAPAFFELVVGEEEATLKALEMRFPTVKVRIVYAAPKKTSFSTATTTAENLCEMKEFLVVGPTMREVEAAANEIEKIAVFVRRYRFEADNDEGNNNNGNNNNNRRNRFSIRPRSSSWGAGDFAAAGGGAGGGGNSGEKTGSGESHEFHPYDNEKCCVQ